MYTSLFLAVIVGMAAAAPPPATTGAPPPPPPQDDTNGYDEDLTGSYLEALQDEFEIEEQDVIGCDFLGAVNSSDFGPFVNCLSAKAQDHADHLAEELSEIRSAEGQEVTINGEQLLGAIAGSLKAIFVHHCNLSQILPPPPPLPQGEWTEEDFATLCEAGFEAYQVIGNLTVGSPCFEGKDAFQGTLDIIGARIGCFGEQFEDSSSSSDPEDDD